MLLISSDLNVPNELDAVRIQLRIGERQKYSHDYDLTTADKAQPPNSFALPTTLAVTAEDSSSVVTIRVLGLYQGQARTLLTDDDAYPTGGAGGLGSASTTGG